MEEKLGYKPKRHEKILNDISKIFSRILSYNFYFTNQIVQNIELKNAITFNNRKLYFRTGHNRLNWRVESFYKEEPLMIEWLNNFNKTDIFLDIGANVGTYTLPALTKVKYAYACEMDLKNSAILLENLLINNLHEKCLILNFGLNNSNCVDNIYYRDNSVGDALQSIGRDQVIPTIKNNPFILQQFLFSLDFIFNNFSLLKPNKIKIDVDGNEKRVFDGGKNIILDAEEIYYEDNDVNDDKEIINEILSNNFKIVSEEKSLNSPKSLNIRNILFKKNR